MSCTVTDPIFSTLSTDPDLAELVEMFVAEMPERVKDLSGAVDGHDWERVQRLAHQLKGSAGSYGFDPVTPLAARLESAARDHQDDAAILAAAQALVELCGRLRAGNA